LDLDQDWSKGKYTPIISFVKHFCQKVSFLYKTLKILGIFVYIKKQKYLC
jgi:hypothetical protein